ncbi:hypothetical protein ACIQRK_06530 [Streptomyces anulatus]
MENKIGFEDGLDAATQGGHGEGWWFFKNEWAVKVTGNDHGDPIRLASEGGWPALKGTVFENGVDAAAAAGHEEGWWFFKDHWAIKVDDGPVPLWGPGEITAEGAWPILKKSIFENGFDAVVRTGHEEGWWFFKGNQTAKVVDGSPVVNVDITADHAWPMLKDTVFAEKIEAACLGGHQGEWWFFNGNQTVKVKGEEIDQGPEFITATGAWPMLKGL